MDKNKNTDNVKKWWTNFLKITYLLDDQIVFKARGPFPQGKYPTYKKRLLGD